MKVNRFVSAFLLMGLILVSFSSFAQSKTLKTESDGFQWYELEQNGKYGAQSMGGASFIPLSRGYTFICYHTTSGGWFYVEKNGSEGACDMTGREVVPPKYDDVSKYESDGFYYYQVVLNNRVGAYDINGRKILTPGRYDNYYTISNYGGYYYISVRLNGKKGLCDIDGREILAPRYDEFWFRNEDGYYFIEVKLNDREGVCDINGREVIAPRYKWVVYNEGEFKINETGDGWKSTGIKLSSLTQTPTEAPTPTPSPTPTPTPTPTPKPIRQPQPFQVWQECIMCGGSGQCRYCYGYGWAANGKDACGICHGTGKCSQCAGHGGQNVIEYR